MGFDLDKKNILAKNDKSKKGFADEEVKTLLDKINSLPDYFTTSSCAGRIILIQTPENGKKYEVKWLFTSHKEVGFEELAGILKKERYANPIWFKQESIILHICCRTLENADRLLKLAKDCGFKRAGIITLSPKIICEIIGAESIATIIGRDSRCLIQEDYLKTLINEANKKMDANKKKLGRFLKELEQLKL